MWTLRSVRSPENLKVKLVPVTAVVGEGNYGEGATSETEAKPPAPAKLISGFEIDSSTVGGWSGTFDLSSQDVKMTQPVSHQALPIIRFMGDNSAWWTLSVSVSAGGVAVYDVVADDPQGTNVRKIGPGLSGSDRDPLVFLNHFGPKGP
jgi:hypothetical protein